MHGRQECRACQGGRKGCARPTEPPRRRTLDHLPSVQEIRCRRVRPVGAVRKLRLLRDPRNACTGLRAHHAVIGRCLGSILAGDYPDERFEVLVVDDLSEDETPAVVERVMRAVNAPVAAGAPDGP